MNLVDRAVTIGFGLAMKVLRRQLWPPFEEAAGNPEQAQDRVLQQILSENATTTFGREHGFSQISTAADFRRAVPVQDYESLREHIEAQELSGTARLTVESPVLYAQTSGTLGAPKYLPITQSGIDRISRAQRMFSTMLAANTDMFSGKIVGIGSPAVEGHLPGGSPYGSASGMVYEGMPSLVRRKYVIGPNVLAIEDHDIRYLAIAALCLAEPAVTGVATANPSTLLRLHSIMTDRFDDLLKALDGGPLLGADRLPAEQQAEINRSLDGKSERADELRSIQARHGSELTYEHIWPNLAAIATWTGGSCGFALNALRPLLSTETKIVELGYSASEVRGAIGVDPVTNTSAPLLTDNWFEFVECDVRDGSDGAVEPEQFLGLHELVEGRRYYIYVTTLDGLYRYDMNDIVAVNGWFARTPCITFIQKGRGVTNITGEKLSESQILNAVDTARRQLGMTTSFFIALADADASQYRLYVEHDQASGQQTGSPAARLAELVDDALGELNIEYGSKRASGRLGPILGFDLGDGTAEAYRADRVDAGQRDAQFKVMHVQNLAECEFDFDAYVRPEKP